MTELPAELWFCIFGYLDVKTATQSGVLVCKTWNNVIQDDRLWKHYVELEFGSGRTRKTTWNDLYKELKLWIFSKECSSGKVNVRGGYAEAVANGMGVAKSAKSVSKDAGGFYYFEVKVIEKGSVFVCGVADETFRAGNSIYNCRTNGIAGGAHAGGHLLFSGYVISDGDTIGMLIDMDDKVFYFYQNGKRIETKVNIDWLCKDLHIACLLSGSTKITLKYLGQQTPDNYKNEKK